MRELAGGRPLSNDRGRRRGITLPTPAFVRNELAEHFPDAVGGGRIAGKSNLDCGFLQSGRVGGALVERAVEPRFARIITEISVQSEQQYEQCRSHDGKILE